jgi:hypothetical protein
MAQRIETVKTFYATLTPEQQKVFDTQAHGGMHRAGMKGGHHGKGMGGMGCEAQGAKTS